MTIPESTSIVLNLTCQQYKHAVTKAHLVIQLACLEFNVSSNVILKQYITLLSIAERATRMWSSMKLLVIYH